MKIIIVGGFLGSGKTTLIIQLAKYIAAMYPNNPNAVAIIENEIGEVGIDDKVLGKGGYAVSTMFSGCVCCSLAGEIVVGIRDLANNLKPEYVILEATGVAYPNNIKENLQLLPYECKIVCLSDAKRWKRYVVPMGEMMKLQLEGADVVVINKIDLVNEKETAEVEQSVKMFNSETEIIKVSSKDIFEESVLKKLI